MSMKNKPKYVNRKCLRCDKLFPSEGIQNRLCFGCKEVVNKWNAGMVQFGYIADSTKTKLRYNWFGSNITKKQ